MKIIRSLSLILALLFARSLFAQDQQIATVVPFANPAFEPATGQPANGYATNSCALSWNSVPSWSFGPNTGVIKPYPNNSCLDATPGPSPFVAYAGYGGTFTQTLALTPKEVQAPSPGWQYVTEGVYTLEFSVQSYFVSYPGYFTVKVTYGTQELCEASTWGTRFWNKVIVSCLSPGYIIIDKALDENGNASTVQSANPFVVRFTVGGWPVLFGKPSMIFARN